MKTFSIKSVETYGLAVCVALMIVTRGKHFGIGFNLPDTTPAIFFFTGTYLRRIAFPVLLMASAASIDYFATRNGASGWCITPAYWFLIPTYLTMWYGGKSFSSLDIASGRQGLAFAGILLTCSVLAFTISSGGFYLYSGYFAEPTAAEFMQRVIRYSPSYVGNIFSYMTLAVIAARGIYAANRIKAASASVS